MTFTNLAKNKALAIVNIFETSRPFGSYSTVAVLNDGAGISYGICQFTHRSGSLQAVIEEYLERGGAVGRFVFEGELARLRVRTPMAIAAMAANARFKKALAAAGLTAEMKTAQNSVAMDRYLLPAIDACRGSNFTLPLSLAVVFDSMVHGSWEKIRDRIRISGYVPGTIEFEKVWITAYVRTRLEWLKSIPRLRVTALRPAFYLNQIMTGRWELELPLRVNGYLLTDKDLKLSTAELSPDIHANAASSPQPSAGSRNDVSAPPKQAQPSEPFTSHLETIERKVNGAAAVYDRVEAVVRTVARRSDAAKSLWTTIIGSIWQSVWAVISFLIGLPKELWLVVAIIAAVFLLAYLYRQITLGQIREAAKKGGIAK